MAEPGDIAEWHRRFAVDPFNRTWDLIEKRHRSEDDDLDMLTSALASPHPQAIAITRAVQPIAITRAARPSQVRSAGVIASRRGSDAPTEGREPLGSRRDSLRRDRR